MIIMFRWALIALCFTCVSFFGHLIQGKDLSKTQVGISARFQDGADLLSSPRVTTYSGQEAMISVAQEVQSDNNSKEQPLREGIFLSVKPVVRDGMVVLEGFVFLGITDSKGLESMANATKGLVMQRRVFNQQPSRSPSFTDDIEMRGMFRLKGKIRVCLHFKGKGSSWLAMGESRHGVELVHVDWGENNQHAVVEKDGDLARIGLKAPSPSSLEFSIPLEDGGTAFLLEATSGQPTNILMTQPNGNTINVELTAEIIE